MIKRSAGILVPLFSIRSEADLGRGDFGGLAAMLSWAETMGHRMIQLLPLDEISVGEASPYNALSVLALDPLYISVRELKGVTAAALKRAREQIGERRLVARETVRRLKLELLTRAFKWFQSGGDAGERAAFENFAGQNADWLHDYALYRALKDRFKSSSWERWPEPLRDRSDAALERAREENSEAIAMYMYWQFLAYRQILAARRHFSSRGALLGGDLAFSPGRDSAEVWARQRLFDLSRTVGAPPDAFNPRGQRWGLPMPNWKRMRAEDWPLLKLRIRRACELYDVIRIDHVVGLFRTFNFGPNDDGRFTPEGQVEQREQGETILRVIREAAGPAMTIGEDLGSVPPWVRESMNAIGFPGYKVVRWEREDDHQPAEKPNVHERGKRRFANPAEYPKISVATTGTHDTETMATWWRMICAGERRNLLESLGLKRTRIGARLDQATLRAILEKLYAAPSILTIEPLQDLFGWSARINLPGTVGPGNWSWRLPATISNLMESAAMMGRAENLSAITRRTGRYDEPAV